MTTPIKFVKLLDKQVPWELIENYITILWHYELDHERSRAHDKIFEYMGVNRYAHDEDEDGHIGLSNKYADALDDIVCEAFVCCGQSVRSDNSCRVCDEKLDVNKSLANVKHYIRLKKLFC